MSRLAVHWQLLAGRSISRTLKLRTAISVDRCARTRLLSCNQLRETRGSGTLVARVADFVLIDIGKRFIYITSAQQCHNSVLGDGRGDGDVLGVNSKSISQT